MRGAASPACYHRRLHNADLHCHSLASDGLLSPGDVVRLAARGGATLVSLTDHDETSGLAEAEAAARESGIGFVPGVEISAGWRGDSVHVVGLGLSRIEPCLADGLARLRSSRDERARRMAQALAAIGIEGSLEGAARHASNPRLLSRTHFARFLVERRHARDVKNVFEHYLAAGKPGYVEHEWASLADSVRWIVASGGAAVLAHPGRYRYSETEMDRLLAEFRDCGGQGLEVVTGTHTPRQCRRFSRLARRFGLAASRGSDYHGPGESIAQPGRIAPLPADLKPVWQLL